LKIKFEMIFTDLDYVRQLFERAICDQVLSFELWKLYIELEISLVCDGNEDEKWNLCRKVFERASIYIGNHYVHGPSFWKLYSDFESSRNNERFADISKRMIFAAVPIEGRIQTGRELNIKNSDVEYMESLVASLSSIEKNLEPKPKLWKQYAGFVLENSKGKKSCKVFPYMLVVHTILLRGAISCENSVELWNLLLQHSKFQIMDTDILSQVLSIVQKRCPKSSVLWTMLLLGAETDCGNDAIKLIVQIPAIVEKAVVELPICQPDLWLGFLSQSCQVFHRFLNVYGMDVSVINQLFEQYHRVSFLIQHKFPKWFAGQLQITELWTDALWRLNCLSSDPSMAIRLWDDIVGRFPGNIQVVSKVLSFYYSGAAGSSALDLGRQLLKKQLHNNEGNRVVTKELSAFWLDLESRFGDEESLGKCLSHLYIIETKSLIAEYRMEAGKRIRDKGAAETLSKKRMKFDVQEVQEKSDPEISMEDEISNNLVISNSSTGDELSNNPANSNNNMGSDDELNARSVFVVNLSYRSTKSDISAHFSSCGAVDSVRLVCTKKGISKGCATVLFKEPAAVSVVYEKLQGKVLDGRSLEIRPALKLDELKQDEKKPERQLPDHSVYVGKIPVGQAATILEGGGEFAVALRKCGVIKSVHVLGNKISAVVEFQDSMSVNQALGLNQKLIRCGDEEFSIVVKPSKGSKMEAVLREEKEANEQAEIEVKEMIRKPNIAMKPRILRGKKSTVDSPVDVTMKSNDYFKNLFLKKS